MAGAVARIHDDYSSRIEQNPGPKFYQGPIKLQARRPEAPKKASAPEPEKAPAAEGH
jgi:hypothetical protein